MAQSLSAETHSHEFSKACGCFLLPLIALLVSACTIFSGAALVSWLGQDKYYSYAESTDALPTILIFSLLLAGILIILLFPSIQSFANSFRMDKDNMPIYGFGSYLSSFFLSMLLGSIVAGIFFLTFFSAIPATFANLSKFFGFSLSLVFFQPFAFFIFSALCWICVITPSRMNWFIRWIFKDFWRSRT